MKEPNETGKGKDVMRRKLWLHLVIFFCILFAVFFGISVLTITRVPLLDDRESLDTFSFTEDAGLISRNLFDYYPEHLYTPEDFASGHTKKPEYTVDSSDNDDRQKYRYGTYRLVLDLPAGETFAMSADSATYAQKVWVNGVLLTEVGKVSDNKEGFIPRTNHYTVCFTTGAVPTEIVVQQSNFVHWSGTLFEVTLGPQAKVFSLVTKKLFRSVAAIGVLFAAFLLFFGVSLFFPDSRMYLWFALACLSICIRNGFVSPKPVMILFPELNWYFGHKLEHIMQQTEFLFTLLFYNAVFPDVVDRRVRISGYLLAAAGIGMYLFLPSTVYSPLTQKDTYCMLVYYVLYVVLFLYGFLKRRKEFGEQSDVLMMAGAVILILSNLSDAYLYRKTKDYNISQIGMMIFSFITAIALTLRLRKAQEELGEAEAKEEQMRLTNHTLTDLHKLRTDFMSDISHEMRTPLTVMSSYAGLTRMQIEKSAINEKTLENLEIIQKEAVRLGELVEKIKGVATDKMLKVSPVKGNVSEILIDAVGFCRPICDRNRNRIKVTVPEEPLYACYVPDSLLQVLYNLITNSNRHCKDSEIILSGEDAGDFISVSVSDHGDGISAELMQHLFERGVSGDHSSGLGLSLCRDIIESGGGKIRVAETSSSGTVICFTVPKKMTQPVS